MYEHEDYDAPDGSCRECGEPTEQEYHRFCRACYAEQQGWSRPAWREDPGRLREQHEERENTSRLLLLERVSRLEGQVIALSEMVASLAGRLEDLEMHGAITVRRGPA